MRHIATAVLAVTLPSNLTSRSLVALYSERTKLVRDLDAWTLELYDLAADPREQAPIRSGPRVAALARLLDAAITDQLATVR